MIKIQDILSESKTSNMMKAIRKHGTAGPWNIIVSKNNKIKKRVSVKNLKEIPAEMDDIRKKFPNHKFGIEAKSGRIAYREEKKACMCEACQKGYMTHPTRKTKIMFGKRYRNCVKKEGIEDRMKDVMNKLAKSLKLKSVQKMATGSGGFSFFMDDEKESKRLAQMLKKHLKRVRIIKLDKQKGDPSDFVVAADMFGL